MEYDYYFGNDYVQIQGRASLPGIKQNKRISQNLAKTKNHATYLSLHARRELCHKAALQNAHSKWLSITYQNEAPQSEWMLRVQKGARGHWGSCLKEAEILQTYYDRPGSCRLVVHYECDPRSY